MVRGEIERFLSKMDFYYYKNKYLLTFFRRLFAVFVQFLAKINLRLLLSHNKHV